MKAVLSIELELLEPVNVVSAAQMQDLHPSQIGSVSIRLTAGGNDLFQPVGISATVEDARVAVRDLVTLAQTSQPDGTDVLLWYQGRSEGFVI